MLRLNKHSPVDPRLINQRLEVPRQKVPMNRRMLFRFQPRTMKDVGFGEIPEMLMGVDDHWVNSVKLVVALLEH